MSTLIIVPAHNEEKVIIEVVKNLKALCIADILVIDDGSKDQTGQVASMSGALVLRHPVNMGVGAATRTGFEYAKQKQYDAVVTCDADGQHAPEDVSALITFAQKNTYDLVIGVRDFKTYWYKKYVNLFADLVTGLLAGRRVKDSQSGLRFIRVSALKKMNLISTGYSISSEILIEAAKNNLLIGYLPIKAIYSEYSTTKQTRQKLSNIFGMIRQLLG